MSGDRIEFLKGPGRNLRRHLEAQGVSAGALAEATAIPQGRIEQILTGEVEVGSLELLGLAECLGIFLAELLEGLDEAWDDDDDALLAETEYELPLLKAYAGGRREGGRPVEDSVGELFASRLTEADHEVDPGGRERWITRLRLRRRLLLDTGLVGFDPRLRVWDLTRTGEARLLELELSQDEGVDPTAGASRPSRGDGDKPDGRSERR